MFYHRKWWNRFRNISTEMLYKKQKKKVQEKHGEKELPPKQRWRNETRKYMQSFCKMFLFPCWLINTLWWKKVFSELYDKKRIKINSEKMCHIYCDTFSFYTWTCSRMLENSVIIKIGALLEITECVQDNYWR